MKRILSLVIFCLTLNLSGVKAQCTADYGLFTNNLTVQFLDSSIIPSGSFTSYFWSFGDGNTSSLQNPSHTYASAGTYFACLTIQDTSNTCFDSICSSITVTTQTQPCTALFSYSVMPGGTTSTVLFSNQSTGLTNTSVTTFDFGDGNSTVFPPSNLSPNAQHSYSPGSYIVTLSIVDSINNTTCAFSDSIFIQNNGPQSCIASYTYSVNPNNSVNFFGNASGGTAPYAYSWNFGFGPGSGSTLANPTYFYTTPGSYGTTLTVTDANGIVCSFYDTVHVNNTCVANFSHQSIGNGVISFSNLSTPIRSRVNFGWNFGDGTFSNAVNPIHSYSTLGTFTVQLVMFDSTTNCTSQVTDTVPITSTSNCQAAFSYTINNDTVFIQNQASNYTSLIYDFGDSTTSVPGVGNPNHVYSQSGSYTICQTVIDTTNNCSDTFCDTVIVNVIPPCKAGFTFSVTDNVVSILNRASSYTSLSYDFGDGSVLGTPNPMYTYSQSGTYTICQTVINMSTGCSDTFCDSVVIIVPPPCQAGFSFISNLGTVDFQSTAQNFTSISYNFGDGSTSSQTNPSHIYANSGRYEVCQIVTNANNCTSTFCDTVSIRIPPPCQAGFSYSIIGDTVQFTSSANSFNRVVYYFGDGDSSLAINPIHDYQSSGSYQVTQVVYNDTINCIDSITQTITVSVSFSCVASYELAIDTNTRGILYLINTSSDDGSHSYFWDFGDGTSSNIRLPRHQFSQNIAYKICLTVSDSVQGCTSTHCDSVGLDSNGGVLKSGGFKLEVIDGSFIGLEEESIFNGVSIYPNPFSDQLTIELKENQKVNYQVIQMNGKVIQEGWFNDMEYDLPLEKIQPGIYFLRLFNKDSSLVKKIIKQ